MANKKKLAPKRNARHKQVYLTKRILVAAAYTGSRKAAKKALEVMGYSIVAEDGWIVRKNSEGETIEKLHAIPVQHVVNPLR